MSSNDPHSAIAGGLRAFSLLVIGGVASFLVFSSAAARPDEDQLLTRVSELVSREYVETRERDSLLLDAIKGMVRGLDPYSRFYEHSELASLEEETSGQYVGIGVHIETAAPPLTVLFPHPGSPADDAGLEPGDRIIAIDGAPVAQFEELAGLIVAYAPGQTVDLEIVRNGEPMMIKATLGAKPEDS